jgi:phage shock protein PspC (stress-responsive transcriptional regulator)
MIAGVVGGIAEYLGVDPTIARVIWVGASLMLPPMLLFDIALYIALAIIIPLEPEEL